MGDFVYVNWMFLEGGKSPKLTIPADELYEVRKVHSHTFVLGTATGLVTISSDRVTKAPFPQNLRGPLPFFTRAKLHEEADNIDDVQELSMSLRPARKTEARTSCAFAGTGTTERPKPGNRLRTSHGISSGGTIPGRRSHCQNFLPQELLDDHFTRRVPSRVQDNDPTANPKEILVMEGETLENRALAPCDH